MKYSKRTRSYAYELVELYARPDGRSNKYDLSIDDVDEFNLEKLAAYIYMDNPDYADESTTPDNKNHNRLMIPPLIMLLKNSLDSDIRKDFIDAWLKGVTDYAKRIMDKLLMEELEVYNADKNS